MQTIRDAIVEALERDAPMTVRQLFYRLTTVGVIAKTENEYGTIERLAGEMRKAHEIPYAWIADSTRLIRRPTTYSSVEDALQRTAQLYRRALWDDAPTVVEVWLEKEALAGVVIDVTWEWDVPLMVTRGFPSLSFTYAAAEAIRARSLRGQHTRILYFGDRDPSGLAIDTSIVRGIGQGLDAIIGRDLTYDEYAEQDMLDLYFEQIFSDHADFERVAVTNDQVEEWNLPTRPTKQTTHSPDFEGDSVELDAIMPDELKSLVGEAIEEHVDSRKLEVVLEYERSERQQIETIAAAIDGDPS